MRPYWAALPPLWAQLLQADAQGGQTPSLSSPAGSAHTGAIEQGLGFPSLSPISPHTPNTFACLFSINESD